MATLYLIPNGMGDSGSNSNGTNAYQMIDDSPGSADDSGTYLTATTTDLWTYDYFAIPNISTSITTIQSLTVIVRGYTSETDSTALNNTWGQLLRINNTNYINRFYNHDWTTQTIVYNVNPNSNAVWTANDINSLQLGWLGHASTFFKTGQSYITQIYAILTYTEPISSNGGGLLI